MGVNTDHGLRECHCAHANMLMATLLHFDTDMHQYSLQVDDSDGAIRLHLPSLHRLKICGLVPTHGSLRFDWDSFLEAFQLESLSLDMYATVTWLPDCLTGLTRLATLQLMQCGLSKIPTALTALRASLTSLALPFNDKLQLANGDIAVLLTLRRLQALDLRKWALKDPLDNAEAVALNAKLQYEPAPWSLRSLQHLVTLPNSFHAQHGHVLALQMCLREDYAESAGEEEEE